MSAIEPALTMRKENRMTIKVGNKKYNPVMIDHLL